MRGEIGRAGWAGDRGSVTAEFAVAMPAVLVVLALVLGSLMLATQRLALTAAAAEVARLEARGEQEEAALRLEQLGDAVRVERGAPGPVHCVTLRSSPAVGALGLLQVSARGCAVRADAP